MLSPNLMCRIANNSLLVNISRLIIGVLFLFSGFVKSVDPLGTAIKFEEYFSAFSMELLIPLALPIAILLIYSEMLLGVLVVFRVFRRFTALIALLFLLIFTLITFYIYLANPVEDCGCFGEFISLTNGQTFVKNIVFLLMGVPYFFVSHRFGWFESCVNGAITVAISSLLILFAPIYAMCYLPIIDFLPYKKGVNIFEAMKIPEGVDEDIYQTVLIYEQIESGKKVEFTLEDTTWHDNSKWKFVDARTLLVKKGYTPAITSFDIFDGSFNNVTRDILVGSRVMMVVINKDVVSETVKTRIAKQIAENIDADLEIVIVTPFDIDTTERELDLVGQGMVFNGDKVLLKSLIRNSVGAILFDDATIIYKFNI
ncbi:MAG: hypothetical protein R3Y04_00910 [Rikenellaceae bacterium]